MTLRFLIFENIVFVGNLVKRCFNHRYFSLANQVDANCKHDAKHFIAYGIMSIGFSTKDVLFENPNYCKRKQFNATYISYCILYVFFSSRILEITDWSVRCWQCSQWQWSRPETGRRWHGPPGYLPVSWAAHCAPGHVWPPSWAESRAPSPGGKRTSFWLGDILTLT